MKKSLLLLAAAISTLLLPGCFQHETTIHLQKDGSGTIVEESRLGAQMLAMFDQMAAGFGGGAGGAAAPADPLKQMFSEDKAKQRATQLGEGVTFEKSEAITDKGAKGARVTFRFKDINQLKLSTGDGMKSMSPAAAMPGMPQPAEVKEAPPIRFTYSGGKLTVRMPEPEKPAKDAMPAAETPGKPDMESPEAQAMVKQMFGDMKMSMKLVIEPGIASTNATHRSGNTITLMEMDMGKLLEKPDTFKKIAEVDQNNPAAAMEAIKGIEGVKFEVKPEITVKVE